MPGAGRGRARQIMRKVGETVEMCNTKIVVGITLVGNGNVEPNLVRRNFGAGKK